MGKDFFTGWVLWQKMTFILAVAIAIVFCIAYGKLLWMNRILKKQEVIDEEKRVRIQELRQSGHIVESSKADVPFGVRAIQSGIQVDGIWISNPSTPVPSEPQFGKNSGSLSDLMSDVDSSKSTPVAKDEPSSSKPVKSMPRASTHLSPFKDKDLDSGFLEDTDAAQAPDFARSHQSYQPRKASHLRYDSYGAYDEETLDQLEGNTNPKTRPQVHQPRGSQQKYLEAESSSAADNELNSATSSDSDNTFSDINGRPITSSIKPSFSIPKSNYTPVPTETPAYEISDPFASPTEGPILSHGQSAQPSRMPSWMDDSQAGSYPDSHSPFVPGSLHQNRNSRRVNSGFEVLPAGTFVSSVDRKGKGVDRDDLMDEDSGERRKSTRLQKRRKDSAVYERPPSSEQQP